MFLEFKIEVEMLNRPLTWLNVSSVLIGSFVTLFCPSGDPCSQWRAAAVSRAGSFCQRDENGDGDADS